MIPRYTNETIGKLFSDEIRFATWLEVELAVMEAWVEKGVVPASALQQVRQKAVINVKQIEEFEKETNHDVVAFINSIQKQVGPDSKYFHLGLTSNDIVDTANNLILCRALDLIIEKVNALIEVLGLKAQEYKNTICIGRTHGIHAEPTTFGLRFANWYAMGLRCREHLQEARQDMSVGKLNGAVGNFANLPPDIEEIALSKLGLTPEPVTTQVIARDHHAFMMSALAILGGFCEMVAVNLRTLQRSEIGETQEPFSKGQKGSSAMPHKRNPVGLERISGLSRLLRTNTLAAYENIALWDERDISHSSVERVIFADSFALAYFIVTELTRILEGLVVNTKKMSDNLLVTQELIYSQKIMLALIDKGLTREEAYDIVQRNAAITIETGKLFSEVLLTDPKFIQYFNEKELRKLINPELYVTHVNHIFKRVGLLDARNRKVKPGKSLKLDRITVTPVAPLPEINIIPSYNYLSKQLPHDVKHYAPNLYVQRMDIDPITPQPASQPLQPQNTNVETKHLATNPNRLMKKTNYMRAQNKSNRRMYREVSSTQPPRQNLNPTKSPAPSPTVTPAPPATSTKKSKSAKSKPTNISPDFTAAKLSADLPYTNRYAANANRKRQEKEQRDLIESRFPPNIIPKK